MPVIIYDKYPSNSYQHWLDVRRVVDVAVAAVADCHQLWHMGLEAPLRGKKGDISFMLHFERFLFSYQIFNDGFNHSF